VIREAQQLLRLRALRVERLRTRCAEAQAAVAQAQRVVHERQLAIEQLRREVKALAQRLVGELAPCLPRWHEIVTAERARLLDQLERQEVGLIDDEEALEAAQERCQQARAELSRALAGQDAVQSLADTARRELARALELRAEMEVEDQGRRRAV
jgi:hypothetical protein